MKGIIALICAIILFVFGTFGNVEENVINNENLTQEKETNVVLVEDNNTESDSEKDTACTEEIPAYSSEPYAVVNNNNPYFNKEDLVTYSYEKYGELDELGRCTKVIANVGKDIMPTEERGYIGMIKPTGWQTTKYEGIDGNYLYNRCHLIGYQLTAENANEKNLITGTRYMNVQGMLPFENMIADYVKETGNHVLYRVTPFFGENDLVAFGVLMEAKSVEDNGEGVLFNVFCYNVQPGIEINYATGESKKVEVEQTNSTEVGSYILNKNSKVIHKPTCTGASQMSEKNKEYFEGNIETIISNGYKRCGSCNP